VLPVGAADPIVTACARVMILFTITDAHGCPIRDGFHYHGRLTAAPWASATQGETCNGPCVRKRRSWTQRRRRRLLFTGVPQPVLVKCTPIATVLCARVGGGGGDWT